MDVLVLWSSVGAEFSCGCSVAVVVLLWLEGAVAQHLLNREERASFSMSVSPLCVGEHGRHRGCQCRAFFGTPMFCILRRCKTSFCFCT